MMESNTKSIQVVGIGPGDYEDMTVRAIHALNECDVIVGYTVYVELIRKHFPEKVFLTTAMKQEVQRVQMAYEEAEKGKKVAFICSGDAGVYGMAGLILGMQKRYPQVQVGVIPGVTAALAGGAILGAPFIHDFALISLSDLLTPWTLIEQRLRCAGKGDFCICLYNPSSQKRAEYLKKACDILMEYKKSDTVCGYVKNIARDQEVKYIGTLGELREQSVDMFTTVFIGNSSTRHIGDHMVTPRGYNNE